MLNTVWEQQKQYNELVKQHQKRSEVEWMETYILGTVSELAQLLDEMQWKRNRLTSIKKFGSNTPEELTDITKYVFSMWILLGYTPEQMLENMYAKGEFLETLFQQEFQHKLEKKVVIFDLDNVLAELEKPMMQFLAKNGFDTHKTVTSNIHVDVALGNRFDKYKDLKNTFELSGKYATLPAIYPTKDLFTKLRKIGYSIVVYTARPVNVFKRIRADTYNWFKEQDAKPDAIFFGREERIVFAGELVESGHHVVLVDDDPGTIKRAKLCEIPYIMPMRGYNIEDATFDGDWQDLLIAIKEFEHGSEE